MKTKEKLIEIFLFLSASSAVIIIFSMAFYLFSEGGKLFFHSPVDEYIEIIAHPSNPLHVIDAIQIKGIRNGTTTNWKELGGADVPITLVNADDFADQAASDAEQSALLLEFVRTEPGALAAAFKSSLPDDGSYAVLTVPDVTVDEFLLGKLWYPTAEPARLLGIFPMILGTILVTIGAILLAVPISLGSAIYLSEFASKSTRNIIKPVIEILAGIPSVVFGFFGLVVIVPFVQQTFELDSGQSGLAGALILALMIVPTIVSISEDALQSVPKTLREASLALGATRWQTTYRVVVPAAITGISTSVLLGIGRAIGETMAVLMVTGNAAVIPEGFLSSMRTLTATIAAELGEAPQGGIHFESLFAIGGVLFIFTFLINITADLISQKYEVSL